MRSILFRCDASLLIGSGHVMRCLTLARELHRQGVSICFLCRRQAGDLVHLLEKEFSVLALPQLPLAPCEGLQGRSLHTAWLGCSQEQDAAQCLQALDKHGISSASWLVVDHYGLDAEWEGNFLGKLKGTEVPKLLVIDDLADRPHQADLLLDQNLGRLKTDYAGLIPDLCQCLIGIQFSLLRPEFAALKTKSMVRRRNGGIHKILVTMGSLDSGNHVEKILQAIDCIPHKDEISVVVAIAEKAPHLTRLRQSVQNLGYSVTLLVGPENIAAIMCDVDVAITASGFTAYECACMNVPMVLLPMSDVQLKVARILQQLGIAIAIEDWQDDPVKKISSTILNTLPCFMMHPAQLGNKLVDGMGVYRVAETLINY